ncbi:MAG: PAS domain S-box protein [Thermomicrobiales bacterium]
MSVDPHIQEGEVDVGEIFAATSLGMALIDPRTGRFLRVNPAFSAITGFTEGELLAMTAAALVHPEDHARDRDRFLALIAGERSVAQMEQRYVRNDGTIGLVQLTADPMRDAAGIPRQTLVVVQDITARRQRDEEEAKSRARSEALATATRALIEAGNSPDAVFTEVAHQAAMLVGDLAVVRILSRDGQWLDLAAVDHPDPAVQVAVSEALATERHPAKRGANGAAVRTGRAQRPTASEIAQRRRDDPLLWPALPQAPTGVLLAAPLRANGRPIGTLSVSRAAADHPFDDDDEAFIQELADRAGLAIERRQLYVAARESEERYHDLLARIEQGFCVIEILYDASGQAVDYRFLEVNPTFARHTGLQNATGKTARELVPGLENHWINLYARVAETGESAHFEQGSAAMGRWFEVEAVRVGAAESRKVALLFQDVTERRQFEAALRQSEFNFRRLANAMPQFVWVTEADGRLSFVNDRWTAFSGLTLEETNDPAHIARLYHPDDRDRLAAAWRRSFAEMMPLEVEARMQDLAGSWRWFLIRGVPIVADDTHVVRWFGTSTDITASKEAEARIAAVNDQFARAEEAAGALSFAWDLETHRIERSAGLRSVLGYEPGEIAPTWEAWSALIHPEHRAATMAEAVATFEVLAASGSGYEYRARHKDGSYRWLFERATLVRDDEGRLHRIVGHTIDVTARKQAEAAREALLDAVAHDLKNPLTALRLQLQLLQRNLERQGGLEPEVLAERLAGLAELTARMTVLIDELGEQRHVIPGHGATLDRQPTDLVALVRHAIDDLAPTEDERPIRVESADDTLVGHWDPSQVRRVLDNLIGNAIKYSPAGGTIEIGLAREDGVAVLTVRDEGIGIPASDLPHIFEIRHRGSNVGDIAGSGVGLAGARQIVEQHGGTIAVESTEGQGSTFTVRLPLGEPHPGDDG